MSAIYFGGSYRNAAGRLDILTCQLPSQNGHLIRSIQRGQVFLYSRRFADLKCRWLSLMIARKPGKKQQNIASAKRQLAWLTCLIAITLMMTGCVQRRLMVRSQPEGAFLTIDNQPIGYTPVSVPFTYYGTREVQLEKDGYKTIKVQERVKPPWYEYFPINFFAENFSPREIRDQRLLDFTMSPQEQVNQNFLYDRASQLRGDVQRGTVTAPIN